MTYALVWTQIFKTLTTGDWLLFGVTGLVYVLSTTEGSVKMMRILLQREKGKRQVGAR